MDPEGLSRHVNASICWYLIRAGVLQKCIHGSVYGHALITPGRVRLMWTIIRTITTTSLFAILPGLWWYIITAVPGMYCNYLVILLSSVPQAAGYAIEIPDIGIKSNA